MAYNFVPCDRDQQFLMPPSLDDWLSKDHLARFVVAVVDTLDLLPSTPAAAPTVGGGPPTTRR
jgi:hypothetical protein